MKNNLATQVKERGILMKKSLKKFSLVFMAFAIITACLSFTACTKQEENNWSLVAEEGTVKAYFSDNGKYGFILNIEGDGKMSDFASKKDAPWYGKSGRITEIRIADGVKAIGANAFTDVKAESVIVPRSVSSVGQDAFNKDTKLCLYEDTQVYADADAFRYSATEPVTKGNFWYIKDGKAAIWDTSGIPGEEPDDQPQKTLKILFIGNSFTYYSDVPSLFRQISGGAGKAVNVESVTRGTWTLAKFADQNDEEGRKVHEKLNSADDYDVVVLQEHSTRPIDNYVSFVDGAKALQQKIVATQKSCKIYLYATWGYQSGADSRGITIPKMEERLRTAYVNAASELGAKVCHVGKAFTKVYTDYPEINLYYEDNKHPSLSGAFLSACVHVATILGVDPRNSSFMGGLDAATATVLKNTAYQIVLA